MRITVVVGMCTSTTGPKERKQKKEGILTFYIFKSGHLEGDTYVIKKASPGQVIKKFTVS